MSVVQRMLVTEPWCRWGLEVRIFTDEMKELWDGTLASPAPRGKGKAKATTSVVDKVTLPWGTFVTVDVGGVDGTRATRSDEHLPGLDSKGKLEVDDG